MIQLYKLFCRNNCMMVTDFLIIHKTCIDLDWFVGKHTGKFPVRTCSTCLKTFFNSRNYVFSDISGIGPWISKNLMVLIEPLHDVQRLFCGKTVFLIGLSLKSCQIIKSRCISFLRLSGNFCYGNAAFSGFCLDLLGTFLLKCTEASALSVTPSPAHVSCLNSNSVIAFRFKFPDLLLSSCDHGKGRCLHTSAGKLCIVFTGQRSGSVHSHQPVCLCPCLCRTVKIIIIMTILKLGKTVTDRLVRYR